MCAVHRSTHWKKSSIIHQGAYLLKMNFVKEYSCWSTVFRSIGVDVNDTEQRRLQTISVNGEDLLWRKRCKMNGGKKNDCVVNSCGLHQGNPLVFLRRPQGHKMTDNTAFDWLSRQLDGLEGGRNDRFMQSVWKGDAEMTWNFNRGKRNFFKSVEFFPVNLFQNSSRKIEDFLWQWNNSSGLFCASYHYLGQS